MPDTITRILSVRRRVPDEPGRPTDRWTEQPLYTADQISRALIDLLPADRLFDVADRLVVHLEAIPLDAPQEAA